jgi:hypothetical protein
MATQIRRLVGVYNADSTWRGELAYWIGARLGRAHCGLCDVTHGLVRERTEWIHCRLGLPVAFDTYHRNDQPDAVRAIAGGVAPIVLAETERGFVVLLEPAELDRCEGFIERLTNAIDDAATRLDLSWPR